MNVLLTDQQALESRRLLARASIQRVSAAELAAMAEHYEIERALLMGDLDAGDFSLFDEPTLRSGIAFEHRLAEIPPYARSYDPTNKTWTVAAPYAALAIDLLCHRFPDARIERPGTRLNSASTGSSRPFVVLHLLPSAPPKLIEGAYRIRAKLSHLDAGGDPEAMGALNDARDALKERVTV